MPLGGGDSVSVQVYGQSDMSGTEYISDSGDIRLPLVGAVHVAGISPTEAAQKIEQALKDGQFLVDPHVTLTVTKSESERVSVLGEVKAPARYVIEPNTSVFDLLAQAGGLTENSSDVVYITRKGFDGADQRIPIDVSAMSDPNSPGANVKLQSGDSVYVPRAAQFYIYGEVIKPSKYRLEHGMTVGEAVALAGGVTPRGSEWRIDLKRKDSNGKEVTRHAKSSDPVLPDDTIQVKESIF